MIKAIIVDDFIYDLKYLKEMINWSEYDIEIIGMYENGKEAFEAIEENQPELVISDIQMSELDGFGLARAIREKYPQIYIVFISCHNDFSYAKEAIALNVSAYITKPFVVSDVKNTVEFVANTIKTDIKAGAVPLEINTVLSQTSQIQDIIKELITEGDTTSINEFITNCICSYNMTPLRKYIKPNVFMATVTMENCVFELGGNLSAILEISGDYWGLINGFGGDDEVINWLANTIITLRCWYISQQKNEQNLRVQKIKEIIDNEFNSEITVKTVAEKLFLSANYTNSIFKSEMKMSIPEYLMQIRVDKAKEMLNNTNKSISQIVEAVGYKHIHNFSKLFVAKVGVSLGEYRKKVKKF